MHELPSVGNANEAELPSPPHFFDIFSGQLIVGNDAYEAHIEAGGNPADVVELAKLLTSKDIEITSGTYALLTTNRLTEWPRGDMETHGTWLNNIVRVEPYNARLNQRTLERAYRLGLAVGGAQKISGSPHFDNLEDYLRTLKIECTYQKGVYDSWNFTDCIEYIKAVSEWYEQHGGKPAPKVFNQYARQGKGPSPVVLQKLTGHSITALLDKIGYPDTRRWSDTDYMVWGVRFMLANDGQVPKFEHIRELSARRRGPSVASLCDYYGIRRYQVLVAENYPLAVQQLHQQFEALKQDNTYGQFIADQPDTIPAYIRSQRMIARCRLIDALHVPLSSDQTKTLILLNNSVIFITAVSRRNQRVGTDNIRRMVHSPEVADIYFKAWPLNDYMNNLAIT